LNEYLDVQVDPILNIKFSNSLFKTDFDFFDYKTFENHELEKVPVYSSKDFIQGDLEISTEANSLLKYEKVEITLIGELSSFNFTKSFLEVTQTVDSKAALYESKTIPFTFQPVNYSYSSFRGEIFSIYYKLKVKVIRNALWSNYTQDFYFCIKPFKLFSLPKYDFVNASFLFLNYLELIDPKNYMKTLNEISSDYNFDFLKKKMQYNFKKKHINPANSRYSMNELTEIGSNLSLSDRIKPTVKYSDSYFTPYDQTKTENSVYEQDSRYEIFIVNGFLKSFEASLSQFKTKESSLVEIESFSQKNDCFRTLVHFPFLGFVDSLNILKSIHLKEKNLLNTVRITQGLSTEYRETSPQALVRSSSEKTFIGRFNLANSIRVILKLNKKIFSADEILFGSLFFEQISIPLALVEVAIIKNEFVGKNERVWKKLCRKKIIEGTPFPNDEVNFRINLGCIDTLNIFGNEENIQNFEKYETLKDSSFDIQNGECGLYYSLEISMKDNSKRNFFKKFLIGILKCQ